MIKRITKISEEAKPQVARISILAAGAEAVEGDKK